MIINIVIIIIISSRIGNNKIIESNKFVRKRRCAREGRQAYAQTTR